MCTVSTFNKLHMSYTSPNTGWRYVWHKDSQFIDVYPYHEAPAPERAIYEVYDYAKKTLVIPQTLETFHQFVIEWEDWELDRRFRGNWTGVKEQE